MYTRDFVVVSDDGHKIVTIISDGDSVPTNIPRQFLRRRQ